MKSTKMGLAALMGALGVAGAVQAGTASDAFGRCLVQSSTGRDRTTFVEWFFVALSVNPSVQPYAIATKAQHADVTKRAAELLQRLVLTDCHAEAVAAIKADGPRALETSFEVFGRTAATELMSDASVQKEMGALDGYIDSGRFAALAEEAKK